MIFFNIHDFLSNLEMNDAGPRATGSLQQTVTVTAGYSDSAREAAIGLRRPESLEIMGSVTAPAAPARVQES